jgi:hypothetical protein
MVSVIDFYTKGIKYLGEPATMIETYMYQSANKGYIAIYKSILHWPPIVLDGKS